MAGVGWEINTAAFERRMAEELAALRVKSEEALHKTAEAAVEIAKSLAHESELPQDVPGELRDSISAGPVEPGFKGATVTISATAPYAAYVELGTSKMSPRPFLRPALHQAKIEAP